MVDLAKKNKARLTQLYQKCEYVCHRFGGHFLKHENFDVRQTIVTCLPILTIWLASTNVFRICPCLVQPCVTTYMCSIPWFITLLFQFPYFQTLPHKKMVWHGLAFIFDYLRNVPHHRKFLTALGSPGNPFGTGEPCQVCRAAASAPNASTLLH